MSKSHRLLGPVEPRRMMSRAEVVRPGRSLDLRYLMPVVDRKMIADEVAELEKQCTELGIDTLEGCRLRPGQTD